jgi:predicted nuclease with TOPRIM domain
MTYYYNPYQKHQIKQIEYAEKDFVAEIYKEVKRDIETLDQENTKLKNDFSRLKSQTWDMYYELKDGLTFLENKLYSAPTATRRRRRVTICANGQKVKVIKGD